MSFRNNLRDVYCHQINYGGFKAQLMQAERLMGDHIHGLPSGHPIPAIPLECLPGAPEGWVREGGTYVVEVDSELGLWFDWTGCDSENTAIIPSVKGMNPITGRKLDSLQMEQYRTKCCNPDHHDVDLGDSNYCSKCEYNCPGQNYVSHPNTLWWDGFRADDGSVRQFFFTDEDRRDVASAVIGKPNTVPAFGFAFYKAKNSRNFRDAYRSSVSPAACGPSHLSVSYDDSLDIIECDGDDSGGSLESAIDCSVYYSKSIGSTLAAPVKKAISICFGDASPEEISSRGIQCSNKGVSLSSSSESSIPRMRGTKKLKSLIPKKLKGNPEERFHKDVSVGGGAKIAQELQMDMNPIGDWNEKPDAVVRLYFVFSEQLEGIIEKGGIKEMNHKHQGYLENVLVG